MEPKFGEVIAVSRRLVSGRTALCDTASEFFIKTGPREKWHSCRYDELLLLLGNDLSNRKTAQSHDTIRDQDSVIPATARNHMERNGAAMAAELKAKAEKALADANFVRACRSARSDGPYLRISHFSWIPTLSPRRRKPSASRIII
jgi:hypothetical protein